VDGVETHERHRPNISQHMIYGIALADFLLYPFVVDTNIITIVVALVNTWPKGLAISRGKHMSSVSSICMWKTREPEFLQIAETETEG